jgi:predicted enzyme related to lactoylglutathione lyase
MSDGFNPDTYAWARCVPELMVDHFEESLSFYLSLGFQIDFDRRESNFAYLSYQGAQIMIDQRHGSAWETADMVRPYGRGINLQIETDNIDQLIARVTDMHIPFYQERTEKWRRIGAEKHGWVEFLIQDPDGYLLRFLQPFIS